MSIKIGTNVASLSAQRSLAKADRNLSREMQELASGSRFARAGDDAAGFAIAEGLRGQVVSLTQAKQNADSAAGLFRVAEGGLNEQNNILIRLRELSIQAASDTVADEEREYLDSEFQLLTDEFDRIARTTRFGSQSLLTGTNKTYEFHLGSSGDSDDVVRYTLDSDTRASTIGLKGLGVASKSEATDSIRSVDDGLMKIAGVRANLGAIQSRLEFASNNLDVQRENVAAAHSEIADVDVARSVSELTRDKLQAEFGASVLAQANTSPQLALRLLS